MERQASAEVGALLLMSRPRSSLPHGWPRPRIWPASDNQPRTGPQLTSSAPELRWVLAAFWNGKLLINRFKRQISGIQFSTGCFQTISLSGENKIINSFFYPKQRTPCCCEIQEREEEIQIHWRLFNLAYGLKRNYLVKMKFYLFINWVGNTKRIKTFLILFLKLLALSSIGSSNQRFSLRFVCLWNKND